MATMADLLSTYTSQAELSSFFIDKIGIVSVKSYGALGDGATDDTTAISDAITAVGTAGGGTVFFPQGTYIITAGRTCTEDNVTFDGDNATLYMSYTTNTPMFTIQGDNVKFTSLIFDSDPAYVRNTNGAFIKAVGASYVYITGCQFYDCPCAGIWLTDDTDHAVITENFVHDSKADGIHVTNGCNDIIVSNNKLYNTGDDSISVVWYVDYVNQPKDIIIEGNLVNSSQGSGITCYHGKNVKISNNYINTTTKHGIVVYNWQTRAEFNEDITITNNTLLNIGGTSSYYGMTINFATRVLVANNNIDTVLGHGILIGQFSTLKIRDNVLRNLGMFGIRTNNTAALTVAENLFIEDNLVDTCVNGAIFVAPHADTTIDKAYITGNRVYNSDTAASTTAFVYVSYTDTVRMCDNRAYSGTDKAMFDSATCTDVIMGNNYPQSRIEYTPTVTSSAGTIATSSATGYYERKGNTVFLHITATITDNGTGSGRIDISLPINGLRGLFSGRESGSSGKALQGIVSTGVVSVYDYANAYPAVSGAVLKLEGTYEIA